MKLAVFIYSGSVRGRWSVREILLKPEPFLHQLEDLPSVKLSVPLRDGLLDLR